jgi:hypothetical protein
MNEMLPSEKRRLRRWSQFRLRTLLLGMLLFSVVLAVLAPFVESYRREWRIYRQLLRRLPETAQVTLEPKAPVWLRAFGAERYMQRIVAIDAFDCDDEMLADVAGLPALKYLRVHSRKLSDKGLKSIEGCRALSGLWLICPQITDRGLQSVAKLNALDHLELDVPLITDAGLQHLTHFNQLTSFDLVAPNVGDQGMQYLSGLPLYRLEMTASVSDRVNDHRALRPSGAELEQVGAQRRQGLKGQHLNVGRRSHPPIEPERRQDVVEKIIEAIAVGVLFAVPCGWCLDRDRHRRIDARLSQIFQCAESDPMPLANILQHFADWLVFEIGFRDFLENQTCRSLFPLYFQ